MECLFHGENCWLLSAKEKLKGRKGQIVWAYNWFGDYTKYGGVKFVKVQEVKLLRRDYPVRNWWWAEYPDGKEYFIGEHYWTELPARYDALPPILAKKLIIRRNSHDNLPLEEAMIMEKRESLRGVPYQKWPTLRLEHMSRFYHRNLRSMAGSSFPSHRKTAVEWIKNLNEINTELDRRGVEITWEEESSSSIIPT